MRLCWPRRCFAGLHRRRSRPCCPWPRCVAPALCTRGTHPAGGGAHAIYGIGAHRERSGRAHGPAGSVTLLGRAEPGELFAEAYACASDEPLLVDVVASEACEVLFLDARRILTQCTSTCEHHSRIIRNLVGTLAHKNLALSRRSLHTGPRTIRARAAVLPRRAGAAGGEPQLHDPVRPPAACRLSECGTQRAVQ